MSNIENVIERLKIMECPTGYVENKVIDIFVEYDIANKNNILVRRDESFDNQSVEGYRIDVSSDIPLSIGILCKSGEDDYVAKVVDVFKI